MEKNSSSGVSFAGLLTILFIGLKLGNVITWTWIWVLSPIWISISISIAILFIVVLFLFIKENLS